MAHRAFKPVSTTTEQGFSLVEVLMAAIVMMGLLIGTNRLVMQGMASSGRAGLRAGLEQEILNDIESIKPLTRCSTASQPSVQPAPKAPAPAASANG